MHKYKAHGATDITGFGLLGHAKNLVNFQKEKLLFKIHTLPFIKNVLQFSSLVGQSAKFRSGRSVETSGGLLICISPEAADKFCLEFENVTCGQQKAFIVGTVEKALESDAVLSDSVKFIEVTL